MSSRLKIAIAVLLSIAGLIGAAIIGLRDANRRPDYCALCHVTARNVRTWMSSDYLAYEHALSAVPCERCHERSVRQLVQEIVSTVRHDYVDPLQDQKYASAMCIRCHGDYSRLAERTSAMQINPHASPHGQQECEDCHRMHAPSVDVCSGCHQGTALGPGWAPQQPPQAELIPAAATVVR